MCVRTCIWIKPSLECCLQTFQTSNHRGVRGRGQVKRRVSIAHSDPVRLLLLLQVWPPGLGRRSRLGQWGACSRTRGSSEGQSWGGPVAVSGVHGQRRLGVTSAGSLLPGLRRRACFLGPRQSCGPWEQRRIPLRP